MNHVNPGSAPSKKLGPDGSSKKERRPGKGQEKSKTDPQQSQSQKPREVVQKETKVHQNIQVQQPQSIIAEAQLSEKELRKLEWQKKLEEKNPQTSKKNEDVAVGLSKAELKAKRREQQEAQRLVKKSAKSEQKPSRDEVGDKKTEPQPPTAMKRISNPVVMKKSVILRTKTPEKGKVQLVNHLYIDTIRKSEYERTLVNYKNVHPIFVRLGVQYSSKKILGSNARCLSLLAAIKCLVTDLRTPPKQDFCRYLESVLQSCVHYLQYCRPFAVSMTNALRSFKGKIQEAAKLEDVKKKAFLIDAIDTFKDEEIAKADEAISIKVNEKIVDGDIILTYGCSSLVKKILLDAHLKQKKFEVIIVDGRPLLEGRQMLLRLVQSEITCTYVQLNALSYVMSAATKVLLGAHALLTNGYVMSRIGTAQVALVAQTYNKPVLVCCETYKFSERAQTDSFVYNELGNTEILTNIDTLEEVSPLVSSKSDGSLQILNLLYDVTPPDLVTAVVTELAILPCTSVPVVLRIKPTEFV